MQSDDDAAVMCALGRMLVASADLELTLAWSTARLCCPTAATEHMRAMLSNRPGPVRAFKMVAKGLNTPEERDRPDSLVKLWKQAEALFHQRGEYAHSVAIHELRPDGQPRTPWQLVNLKSTVPMDDDPIQIDELTFSFRDLALAVHEAEKRHYGPRPRTRKPCGLGRPDCARGVADYLRTPPGH